MELKLTISQTTRDCPDTNVTRAGRAQRPGAIVRRRPGGKDVVHNDDAFAVQLHSVANVKRVAHIDGALIAPEQCLRGGGLDAAQEFCVQRNAGGAAQLRPEEFSLVKFALTLFQGMQRDGNDEVPVLAAQDGDGFAEQQAGEEIFKPKRAGIFKLVNGIEHDRFGYDGGAGGSENEFHIAAVVAFEGGGQIALERQAAAFAEGRADILHELAAFDPDETPFRRGRFILAKSADLGIKQAQRGTYGGFDEGFHHFYLRMRPISLQKFLNKIVATVFLFVIFSVPF
jgi:hypothetical protein